MVLLLAPHVFHYRGHVVAGDGEGAVTASPLELGAGSDLVRDQVRRGAFHLLYEVRDCDYRRKLHHHMYVIGRASDRNGHTLEFARCRVDRPVEPCFPFRTDERIAVPGSPDQMTVQLCERPSHLTPLWSRYDYNSASRRRGFALYRCDFQSRPFHAARGICCRGFRRGLSPAGCRIYPWSHVTHPESSGGAPPAPRRPR